MIVGTPVGGWPRFTIAAFRFIVGELHFIDAFVTTTELIPAASVVVPAAETNVASDGVSNNCVPVADVSLMSALLMLTDGPVMVVELTPAMVTDGLLINMEASAFMSTVNERIS